MKDLTDRIGTIFRVQALLTPDRDNCIHIVAFSVLDPHTAAEDKWICIEQPVLLVGVHGNIPGFMEVVEILAVCRKKYDTFGMEHLFISESSFRRIWTNEHFELEF